MTQKKDDLQIKIGAYGEDDITRVMNKVAREIDRLNTRNTKVMNSFGSTVSRLKNTISGYTVGIGLGTAAGWGMYKGIGVLTGASNELENSLMGLSSVAEAFGHDADKVKKSAISLASDGLMTVADAATSLKNLLARGFNLEEATRLMDSFKDSAAFGKQAGLGFGEAIKGATEGLKNENSVLVDNAGVTKNVSVMWADYAKQLGVGVKSLTTAQKRQAELNGIIKETKPFLGDAGKLTKTYSGDVAALDASILQLKASMGDQLKPVLRGGISATKEIVDEMIRLNEQGNIASTVFSGLVAPFELFGNIALFTGNMVGYLSGEIRDFFKQFEYAIPTAPVDDIKATVEEIERIKTTLEGLQNLPPANPAIIALNEQLKILEDKLKLLQSADVAIKTRVEEEKKSATPESVDGKTKDLRTKLALERLAIIARAQEDGAIKNQILMSIEYGKFAQTTNDTIALEQFKQNMFLQAKIDANASELEAEKTKKEELLKTEEEYQARKLELIAHGKGQEAIGAEIVAKTRMEWLKKVGKSEKDGVKDTISNISQMSSIWAEKNKAMFRISQMASIAKATMNAREGFTTVMADDTVPTWLKPALAGSILALGMAQVAQIASTSFGGGRGGSGGASGGIPSSPTSTTSGQATTQSVNNTPQATYIFQIGDKTINVSNDSEMAAKAREMVDYIEEAKEDEI